MAVSVVTVKTDQKARYALFKDNWKHLGFLEQVKKPSYARAETSDQGQVWFTLKPTLVLLPLSLTLPVYVFVCACSSVIEGYY